MGSNGEDNWKVLSAKIAGWTYEGFKLMEQSGKTLDELIGCLKVSYGLYTLSAHMENNERVI